MGTLLLRKLDATMRESCLGVVLPSELLLEVVVASHPPAPAPAFCLPGGPWRMQVGGDPRNFTLTVFDKDCCINRMVHQTPDGLAGNLHCEEKVREDYGGVCGSKVHFSQWYGNSMSYRTMRKYELDQNTTFKHIIKVRRAPPRPLMLHCVSS